MSRPQKIDDNDWLAWLHNLSQWPEPLRPLGEKYPGLTCYRLGKAHIWIQNYTFAGTYGEPELYIDGLQAKDSIFPGITVTHVNVKQLAVCDCGQWIPPTKEQGQVAEARYKAAVMRMKKVLN